MIFLDIPKKNLNMRWTHCLCVGFRKSVFSSLGPLLVDFGEVCAQSVCTQRLEMTNGLPWFVWVQLEVDCPELRASSPLSHVLEPRSCSTLPLTFQSSSLGPFIRSLSYSVNQRHPGQVLIKARVVPLSLELSANLLLLSPVPSLAVQSGYRSSVTLRNRLNHAARFTWQPVVTDNGILFSVRPATGTGLLSLNLIHCVSTKLGKQQYKFTEQVEWSMSTYISYHYRHPINTKWYQYWALELNNIMIIGVFSIYTIIFCNIYLALNLKDEFILNVTVLFVHTLQYKIGLLQRNNVCGCIHVYRY